MRAGMKGCVALALALALLLSLAAIAEADDAATNSGDFPSFAEFAEQYMNELMNDGTVYSYGRDGAPSEIPEYDAEAAKTYIDASQYYLANLAEAAEALSLPNYEEVVSEAPYQYSNDALTIGGFSRAEYFSLSGAGYTLFGAAPGMDIESAKVALSNAGLVLLDDSDGIAIFEHPSGEGSIIDIDGFDSCINVWYQDGIVTLLDWSTYTG